MHFSTSFFNNVTDSLYNMYCVEDEQKETLKNSIHFIYILAFNAITYFCFIFSLHFNITERWDCSQFYEIGACFSFSLAFEKYLGIHFFFRLDDLLAKCQHSVDNSKIQFSLAFLSD